MKSHEVLREAAETVGVKALAGELRLSPALVYKWCQLADRDDPEADRIRRSWEQLKSSAEQFTAACERGLYSPESPDGDQCASA